MSFPHKRESSARSAFERKEKKRKETGEERRAHLLTMAK
jgi:hypothetical protein